jgi:small subunit ribosomal protein S9
MTQASSQRAVYWGTGRRKTAVARVRLVPGTGKIIINDRPGDQYLQYQEALLASVKGPLEILGLENSYDILVRAMAAVFTARRMRSSWGWRAPSARWIRPIAPFESRGLSETGSARRGAEEIRPAQGPQAPQYSKR